MPDTAAAPRYEVASSDFCIQGFERLRSTSEFMLNAHPRYDDSLDDLRSELHGDLQACMRPDDFDFDAARTAIDSFLSDAYGDDGAAKLGPLLGMEEPPLSFDDRDQPDDGEAPIYFLYVQDNAQDSVATAPRYVLPAVILEAARAYATDLTPDQWPDLQIALAEIDAAGGPTLASEDGA